MFVSIINDCRDSNAMNRQVARAAQLFKVPVSPVAVTSDIEAAGNLIDTLDACEGKKGIILANVAPRHGKAKKWPNGTPFGHLKYKEVDIYATVDGLMLSLLKKYGVAEEVNVYDIPTVMDAMIAAGEYPAEKRGLVVDSQFRSYEFLPRVAAWHQAGKDIPTDAVKLSELLSVPKAIWWVDNFGNCKTTLWAEDVQFEAGKVVETEFGAVTCYNRLKDVPDDQLALIVGSSGMDDHRFLELVVQGKSAAEKIGAQPGSVVIAE